MAHNDLLYVVFAGGRGHFLQDASKILIVQHTDGRSEIFCPVAARKSRARVSEINSKYFHIESSYP